MPMSCLLPTATAIVASLCSTLPLVPKRHWGAKRQRPEDGDFPNLESAHFRNLPVHCVRMTKDNAFTFATARNNRVRSSTRRASS